VSGRLDRTSGAAMLLIALGTFWVANAAIGIAGADWYNAIVLDVIDRSVGPESSALPDAWAGFTTRLIQLGWIVGLLEGILNWLAAGVLMRGRSWGRIAGLVLGAVGLFGLAYALLGYMISPEWIVPMPAFAWMDRAPAIVSSVATNAFAAAGYAAILLLLGRGHPAPREGSVLAAN
jgi:hypothetical protein